LRWVKRSLSNKECEGLQRISLDGQGEAVAVAVAVVTGTVFSGVGTVFTGGGAGSSTVRARAGGTGGAALSVTTDEPDEGDPEDNSDNHPHTQRHKECLRGHLVPFRISEGGARSFLPP